MQRLNRMWIMAMLLVLLPAPACARLAAPGGVGEPVWQPASQWDHSTGLFRSGDVPADYDPWVLALGRSVYADLQRAREAALRGETTNLAVALGEARDSVRRLRSPAGVLALDAQLQVIRNDLHGATEPPHKTLWVPVEAEISKVRVYAPDSVRRRADAALRNARAYAGGRQPDVTAASMQYSLGMFPLDGVRKDLAAASAAAAVRPVPDRDGVLRAVQDALAEFRWYTQQPPFTLLSTEVAVTRACRLARGMYSHPEWWRRVRGELLRAQRLLAQTPGEWPLLRQTRRTLYDVELHRGNAVTDTRSLLDAVRAQIERQRHAAEHYRRSPRNNT